jgi:dTDP-glucose 4,6-dehydratase
MTTIAITGAAGFVGHHLCDHVLATTDWNIVALDRLTYAGRLDRLAHLRGPRVNFIFHDFRAQFPPHVLRALGPATYLVHNGGETHVNNSLTDPRLFMESNVTGTMNVLEACRALSIEKMIFTSTDEVFGPAPEGVSYVECDPIRPSNPYSASKASGEALCHAWHDSFHVPTIVTRTMNMFGERQHPEKFVPLVLKNALHKETVLIHASASHKVGSRCWLHARNQADAMLFLLHNGAPGETYHVAGDEYTNSEIAALIGKFAGVSIHSKLVDAESHRPGHDLRYALSDFKLRSMGWKAPVEFRASLQRTVEWTLANPEWLMEESRCVSA